MMATAPLACGHQPTSVLSQRTPVVSLTLIAGESLHVASVAEAQRGDSAISRATVGIGPDRAELVVIGPDDVSHPLAGTAQVGKYTVMVDVQPGARYRLSGTIDGRTVSAATIVPSSFLVRRPASDPITSDDGEVSPALFVVPYVFESDGVTGYEVRVIGPSGSVEISARLDASEGDLQFFRTEPGLRDLVLLAYNSDAAEWLLRTTPRSNLTGAFGGFGAALVEQRALVVP